MILVTGGTGFIGAYIIRLLVQKGHSVRALRRSSSKLPFFILPDILEQVEWVEGDILDIMSIEDAMEGVDAVVHSAAMVSFSPAEREAMYNVNVDGTANMVNMALEKNIRRFIHISSVAALGRSRNGETVNEEKEWQDSKINTHYAISKHKAEMEVWRAAAEGLNVVVVNPSTVLGFGDWNTSSCAIFKTAYKEFPYYTSGINGFVYIEDVAAATVRLLESNVVNERFILNGENWPFRQLFDTMAEGFDKKKPHMEATPFLAGLAWRTEKLKSLLSGHKPVLSKETASLAQTKTFFTNTKILEWLPGFEFTPLRTAILNTCRLYAALHETGRVNERL